MEIFNEDYLLRLNKKIKTNGFFQKLILDLNFDGPHFKEDVVFLFANIKNFKKSLKIIKMLKSNPSTNKETIKNINLINVFLDSSDVDNCKNLLKTYFPLSHQKINIIMEFETTFNALQEAAFQANITNSEATFEKFCKEIDLFYILMFSTISSNIQFQYFYESLFNENDKMYNRALSIINNNYTPIGSITGHGLTSFTSSGLTEYIKNVGCDKFITIINDSSLNYDVETCFNSCCKLANILKKDSLKNIEPLFDKMIKKVMSIPTNNISSSTIGFMIFLLEVFPEQRIKTKIINHLPKINNKDVGKLFITNNQFMKDFTNLVKYFEIEQGINDLRSSFSIYTINQKWLMNKDNFDEEKYVQFVREFWKITSAKIKQDVANLTVLELLAFNTLSYRAEFKQFFPNTYKKSMRETDGWIADFHHIDNEKLKLRLLEFFLSDKDVSIEKINQSYSFDLSPININSYLNYLNNLNNLNEFSCNMIQGYLKPLFNIILTAQNRESVHILGQPKEIE